MSFDPGNKKCREALKKLKRQKNQKKKVIKLSRQNIFDEFIKIYDEALLIDPNNRKLNSVILCNRALAYVKNKEYKKSLEDLNLSIEQYFRSYLRQADIQMKMGQFDQAIQDYKKSIGILDPSQNVDQLIKEAKFKAK